MKKHKCQDLKKDLSFLTGALIPESVIREQTRGGRILRIQKIESQKKFCYFKVLGTIDSIDQNAPNIEWCILLPEQWNGRSVQVGGGANNGQIPALEHELILSSYRPIEHHYVVYGDDSGHQSEDMMSADFAENEESLYNYIRNHLIKTSDVMHYIVKECYGMDAQYNYFVGGSTGGREALECATTYGKDYDGIFCASPASNFVMLRMWGAFLAKSVYDSYDIEKHPYSDGFISEEIIACIQKDAIDLYDEMDGLADGIVSNIYAARANRDHFLELIRTKYQLSDAQIQTIKIYEEGIQLNYALPTGCRSYAGCSALEGGLMDLGPDPVPREPLDTKYNVHHGDRADGIFKHFIMKDKTWKLIAHDYSHPDKLLKQRLTEASLQYDCCEPDFDDFVAHGGKLILYTSWNDMSISPYQVVRQYQNYVKKYGEETVKSFIRFYCMPSATHCAGIQMDYLEWLDTWCTEDSYPKEILYGIVEKNGAQMPMAEFPGWVKYVGGDPKKGSSYVVSYDVPDGFWDESADCAQK